MLMKTHKKFCGSKMLHNILFHRYSQKAFPCGKWHMGDMDPGGLSIPLTIFLLLQKTQTDISTKKTYKWLTHT